MEFKSTQEVHASYMDGVRVKISENYKPPPRINPITTYTQRILQNQQIQNNIPHYDFSLENSVKEKMKELKNARHLIRKEKQMRLEHVRAERQKLKTESDSKNKLENEEKDFYIGASNPNLSCSNSYSTSDPVETFSNSISTNNFATKPAYSHILTPILLEKPVNATATSKLNDKSPLNISDFESDNSSPFDNIELKTINDLEELAQVLKNNESKTTPYVHTPLYNNYSSNIQPLTQQSTSYYNYNSGFVATASNEVVYPQMLSYSTANGYYYPPYTVGYDTNSYRIPQTYSKNGTGTSLDTKPSNVSVGATYKSVPDIMKALQDELSNVHVSSTTVNSPETTVKSLKTSETNRKHKEPEEDKDEAFLALPLNLKSLAKSVSSMGFPLSRVSRVCSIIGEDQKKVVEHLLAMSQLLDLGFSEKEVSEALIKNDNDRDKALDMLIS